jgi:hypothetical protein
MEGVPTMGRVLVLLSALSIEFAQAPAAPQCLANRPAVTVQVRDYAHVRAKSLAKAEAIAGRMYRQAGIGIEWLGEIPRDSGGAHNAPEAEEPRGNPVAQLTIDIVTASIARRRGYSDDVVGFVAVPPEGGMGRVGHVVYERIKDVAAGGAASTADILGIIIAHDIGRLILGAGSGTLDGVMTRTWNREDLQRVNPMALRFTPAETERLHATLRQDSASFAVGTGGAEPECIPSRDDAQR